MLLLSLVRLIGPRRTGTPRPRLCDDRSSLVNNHDVSFSQEWLLNLLVASAQAYREVGGRRPTIEVSRMRESFGARMRQQRERHEVALTTIAEQTKIKLSLLQELERDDVRHWPFGIFRRAFIRAYAQAIGLEPDVVVREFLDLYPDPTDVIATEPEAPPGRPAAREGSGPPTRFQYLVGSAMGSLSRFRSGGVQPRASASDTPPLQPPTSTPPPSRASFEPDFAAAARLCTELGQLDKNGEVAPLLHTAASVLDAVGVIVWVWDPQKAELTATMSSGYSDKVLAQLPAVKRDAHNATAMAFRSAQPCVIGCSERGNGAIAVPMMAPTGCVGVLAVELQRDGDEKGTVRQLVTIFAAQLARWIGVERVTELADRRLA